MDVDLLVDGQDKDKMMQAMQKHGVKLHSETDEWSTIETLRRDYEL
ncbi:MAG: hypothetical protein ACE5GZ_00225 [Gammaproteobacteria bacterium]